MREIKIGFIGCGKHATTNIYPSVNLLGYPIACVCAKHIDHAEATAKKFQAARAYDNYHTMLTKEKLDAIFVITQGEHHAEIVKDCLNAGIHVFVEKPLGLNEKEAAGVAAVSKETGKHVMVGFMKRFAPSYTEIKRVMKEKSFGNVLSFYGMFGIGSRMEGNRNYLLNMAIHTIDLIPFLFGEIKTVIGLENSEKEYIDQVFNFVTNNGTIGTLFFAGLPSWNRHWEELTVTGTHGFVKTENMTRVSYHFHKEFDKTIPRWQAMDEHDEILSSVTTSSSGGFQDLYTNGYVGEIRHFLESVEADKTPSPSAFDNVKTMALYDRMLTVLQKK